MVKIGGTIGNINYFGEGDILPVPRIGWAYGGAREHPRWIDAGRTRPDGKDGRARHEQAFRPRPSRCARFNGLDKIGDALEMMHHKPEDVIKPVVII